MATQLTVKEALEQGYKYCGHEDSYLRHLDLITDNDFEDSMGRQLYLYEKDGYHFTISADTIREKVIEDIIECQEEVSDEDGELCVWAADADFEKLADDINERMSVKTYYDLTDIKLVP